MGISDGRRESRSQDSRLNGQQPNGFPPRGPLPTRPMTQGPYPPDSLPVDLQPTRPVPGVSVPLDRQPTSRMPGVSLPVDLQPTRPVPGVSVPLGSRMRGAPTPGSRPRGYTTPTDPRPRGDQSRTFDRSQKSAPRVSRRVIILVALLSLLIVSAAGVIGAINAYGQYTRVHASVEAGMAHLRRAQTIISPLMKHPALPDIPTVTQVQVELNAAEGDFASARREVNAGAIGLAGNAPGLNGTVHSVSALLAAADEACLAGIDLTSGSLPVLAAIQGGFFAASPPAGGASASGPSAAPALSQAMLDTLTTKYEDAVARLNIAIANLRSADLSSLPSQLASAQQVAQIRGALAIWPGIQSKLATADSWLHVAPALLGLSKPERFLIEIMDRGEMRSTGGFIGSYGVMTISQGKIQPFTLSDIFALDIPYVKRVGYSSPPAAYSWLPFKGFGLRDSNLSPDFPTSAQLGISMLAKEGGGSVQGVIAMNATTIERVMKIFRPVTVPGYNAQVTYKNLESMIRLYTETSAQRDGNDLPVGDH